MKKLLGAIFGSSKNTETVLQGLDKVFFTNEEKSDFFLKYLAATQPQNLARRLIAIAVDGDLQLFMVARLCWVRVQGH